MKQILVIMAAVVLVGCGKKEPDLRSEKIITPNEAANELFVESVQLISRADGTTGRSAFDLYEQGLGKLEEIITKHSKSDLAVKLISGETLPTNKSLQQIRGIVAELKPSSITDLVVESAIRKALRMGNDRYLTEADLVKVTGLDFYDTQITDAGLKELAKLKNLEELSLRGTQITDAGLKEVAKLQQLTTLYLYKTNITDTGLEEVGKLKQLETLGIDDTKITDAGLKDVAELQNLTFLALDKTKITDEGLKEVAKLQKLFQLYLEDTKVTKAGVAELKKALPDCNIEGPQSSP